MPRLLLHLRLLRTPVPRRRTTPSSAPSHGYRSRRSTSAWPSTPTKTR
ncbi:hypothetical protein L917_03594 [Phytophthora nicotianae]|uniref:Uncharacterized protein n=1 Tax=Phytophthora nicotianae TaxID=4792 RepID=W2LSB1_PHYNI|nr:hypothetical protein L917_03594 [Phytophthora nicotianae]